MTLGHKPHKLNRDNFKFFDLSFDTSAMTNDRPLNLDQKRS